MSVAPFDCLPNRSERRSPTFSDVLMISFRWVLVNSIYLCYRRRVEWRVAVATIGERLRQVRNRKVWTQEDLARESGVPVVTISRIENGRHEGQPRQSTIRRLAAPLGVEPAWLVYG